MNKILLVITTYHQADYTARCLETLEDVNADVVCVDDASTDHTKRICEDHGVEFVTRNERKGLTFSWNLAYQRFMKGEYDCLIVANNDLLFPTGVVENMAEALKEQPLVSVMSRKNEKGFWNQLFAVETYYELASEFVDHPPNYQKVQAFVAQHLKPSKAIHQMSGFCFGVNRDIEKYEFSQGQLFNPANVNVHQEQDLLERCPGSLLCLNAFVYHFKGVSFRRRFWPRVLKALSRLVGREWRDDRNKMSYY